MNFLDNVRTRNLVIQSIIGMFLKGVLFLITYLQIPFFVKIFNKDEFGIWVTCLSFYNWFILFDFGIGHGLKNILSEKLVSNDLVEIKKVVSNGLALGLIFTCLLIVLFQIFSVFIDFSIIFNSNGLNNELSICIKYTFYSCVLLFFNNSINAIMNSVQKSSYTNILNLFVNLSLLFTSIIYGTMDFDFEGPVVFLSKVNLYSFVLVFCIILFVFFSFNKNLMPNFKLINYSDLYLIMKKGFAFFIIQITVLIIFPIDTFLISKFTNTYEAGKYNLVLKLFSYTIVFISIVNQSSWPAFTEAYYKKDSTWIRKVFKKINLAGFIVFLTLLPLSLYINVILKYWTKTSIYIVSQNEIISFLLLHFFYIFSFNYTTILYSLNELKSQIYLGLILVIFKIIMVYYLVLNNSFSILTLTLSSFLLFSTLFFVDLYLLRKKIMFNNV